MGLFSGIKAQRALIAQNKGNTQEAMRLYEEAVAEGVTSPRYILSYALLLIRDWQFEKAKDLLVKNQKAPGMTPEQRLNLIVDYAVCCYRLGNLDKAISKLEEMYRKNPAGLIYQTLGYLYVVKYDQANKPDFSVPVENAAEKQRDEDELDGEKRASLRTVSPEEAWKEGIERAQRLIRVSLEYDDEDPVLLDNAGQFYYRVTGDKETAEKWFKKALEQKDNQIDTLWFLSRYDLDRNDKAAALEKLEKAAGGNFSPLNYITKQEVENEIARLKA